MDGVWLVSFVIVGNDGIEKLIERCIGADRPSINTHKRIDVLTARENYFFERKSIFINLILVLIPYVFSQMLSK